MLIFRIENDKQVGPFVSGAVSVLLQKTQMSQCPLPESEEAFQKAKIPNSSLHFGCASFEQLLECFGVPQLRILFSMGFKIVVFESEALVQSNTQVGFKRNNLEQKLSISSMDEFRPYYRQYLETESISI